VFRSPLTDYDTWACLTPGFVLLATGDHVLGLGWIWRDTWTTVAGIFAVACAYVAGQTCASVASFILERGLVHRVLCPPSLTLLDPAAGPAWARAIWPSYYKRLAAPAPERLRERAAAAGAAGSGDATFQWAYSVAREDKLVGERLATFINQYGMARNTALAGALCALTLLFLGNSKTDLYWSGAAFFSSYIMLIRFLKYYRLYTVELFRYMAYKEI
jgi:hypothetical protein